MPPSAEYPGEPNGAAVAETPLPGPLEGLLVVDLTDADWSSVHSLPDARAFPEARVLVMSGRTGGWKGVVSVHSWVPR